jgi:hypothetical protein
MFGWFRKPVTKLKKVGSPIVVAVATVPHHRQKTDSSLCVCVCRNSPSADGYAMWWSSSHGKASNWKPPTTFSLIPWLPAPISCTLPRCFYSLSPFSSPPPALLPLATPPPATPPNAISLSVRTKCEGWRGNLIERKERLGKKKKIKGLRVCEGVRGKIKIMKNKDDF